MTQRKVSDVVSRSATSRSNQRSRLVGAGRWCACCVVAVWAVAVRGQTPVVPVSVYLEDSPAVQELVKRAGRLRDQDRLADAANLYQEVIREYPRKIMAKEGAVHVDASQWVYEELMADEQLLEIYRRVHEGAAQQALEQATAPVADADALERVLSEFRLCGQGLSAGLWLAGLYLEQANPHDAAVILDRLEDHPDLNKHRSRWHLLQAAAGLFGADPQRLEHHRALLDPTDDAKAIDQIDRWSRHLQPPLSLQAIDPFGVLPAVAIPDPLGVPLWSKKVDLSQVKESPLAVRGRVWANTRQRRQSRRYSRIPVARGERLYIADTNTIEALDRSSGRRIWHYSISQLTDRDAQVNAPLRALSARINGPGQWHAVAVNRDRLVAVLGAAHHIRPGLVRGGSMTRLVCLEPQDGSLLWQAAVADLDPTLATGDFYGWPVEGYGRIYVLVRRNQRSGFQDTYVVALDAASGQKLWRRHLFSVALGRSAGQDAVQLSAQRGVLFVADSLGNVVCLEARNGTVLWLNTLYRTQPHPIGSPTPRRWRAEIWQPNPPLWVEAGLLVTVRERTPALILLDPATGQVKRRFDESPWSEVSYLAPAPGGVLAVGRTVRLLDGADLSTRWENRLAGGGAGQVYPAGLGVVTEDAALIPTDNQLVVMDLHDGQIVHRHAIEEPGNVLALADQVVIAGEKSLRSYLSWDRARQQLTAQMRSDPADPEPGLALAHVSLAVKKEPAILEGVDHAIAAVTEQATASDTDRNQAQLQQKVFGQMLALIQSQHMMSEVLKRQLLDRLATVTAGPQDEVAYHLARGAFLESIHEPARAVDHYQTILNNPVLSTQMHGHDTGWRQGGIEARKRLAALIELHGRDVYERHESEAAGRLAELVAEDSPDRADDLTELARRYVLTSSASQAMAAAGEALYQRGERRAAMRQFHRAFRFANGSEALGRIAGRIVELYQHSGQAQRASQWLRGARRRHPAIAPWHDGEPRGVEQWLSLLVVGDSSRGCLPRLTLPLGHPTSIPERSLATPASGGRLLSPQGLFVTSGEGEVTLREARTLEPRWRFAVGSPMVELLAMDEEQVLLWTGPEGVLMSVDTQQGHEHFPALNTRSLLADSDDGEPIEGAKPLANQPAEWPVRRRRAQGKKFPDPRGIGKRQLRVAVGEGMVCVADAAGRVVGVNRHSGEVLWRLAESFDRLDRLVLEDDVLVLAGQGRKRSGRSSRRRSGLLVVNALTGEPLSPRIDQKEQIKWVGLGDDGLLFYTTADQLVAHDVSSGAVEWGMTLTDLTFRGPGWIGHDLLVLQLDEFDGTLITVDTGTGVVANRVAGLFPDRQRQLDVQNIDEQWHLLTPLQSLVLDRRGKVQWRDAIHRHSQERRVLELVSERFVVLVNQTHYEEGRLRYKLYLLDRSSGVIHAERAVGPFDEPINPEYCRLVDERVVLAFGSSVVVVPGAGAGQ